MKKYDNYEMYREKSLSIGSIVEMADAYGFYDALEGTEFFLEFTFRKLYILEEILRSNMFERDELVLLVVLYNKVLSDLIRCCPKKDILNDVLTETAKTDTDLAELLEFRVLLGVSGYSGYNTKKLKLKECQKENLIKIKYGVDISSWIFEKSNQDKDVCYNFVGRQH
jgi:hypothetical protein